MAGFPEPLTTLLEALGRLPGIGSRSAERLAFYILKSPAPEALQLARAIEQVKARLVSCRECLNFSERELCSVCSDPERDRELLMVVEHPRDLVAFERSGHFRGLYHVLLGHVSPHEGSDLEHLSADRLLQRVRNGHFREIILATNPTAEGDATALALGQLLSGGSVPLTRLSRGLAAGYSIEYAGIDMLADALDGRSPPQLQERSEGGRGGEGV